MLQSQDERMSGAYKPITRVPRVTKLTKNVIRRAEDKIEFAAACLARAKFILQGNLADAPFTTVRSKFWPSKVR